MNKLFLSNFDLKIINNNIKMNIMIKKKKRS